MLCCCPHDRSRLNKAHYETEEYLQNVQTWMNDEVATWMLHICSLPCVHLKCRTNRCYVMNCVLAYSGVNSHLRAVAWSICVHVVQMCNALAWFRSELIPNVNPHSCAAYKMNPCIIFSLAISSGRVEIVVGSSFLSIRKPMRDISNAERDWTWGSFPIWWQISLINHPGNNATN